MSRNNRGDSVPITIVSNIANLGYPRTIRPPGVKPQTVGGSHAREQNSASMNRDCDRINGCIAAHQYDTVYGRGTGASMSDSFKHAVPPDVPQILRPVTHLWSWRS